MKRWAKSARACAMLFSCACADLCWRGGNLESWIRCCKVRPTWATGARLKGPQRRGSPRRARPAARAGQTRAPPRSPPSAAARPAPRPGHAPGLGQGGIAAPRPKRLLTVSRLCTRARGQTPGAHCPRHRATRSAAPRQPSGSGVMSSSHSSRCRACRAAPARRRAGRLRPGAVGVARDVKYAEDAGGCFAHCHALLGAHHVGKELLADGLDGALRRRRRCAPGVVSAR